MSIRSCFILILFSAIRCLSLSAQERDTIALDVTLEDAVIRGSRISSPVRISQDGCVVFNFSRSEALPKLFGYADPLRYVQMLPGVQTNSEFQGGIHIQGCDDSHNDITIEGVSIYNPVHLFGFFSTFNASHYDCLELNRCSKNASSSNRIGGILNLSSSPHIHDSTSIRFTAGLLSSEISGRIRLSPKTCLTATARVSYLNLLYGSWLKFDDINAKYTFYDANFSLVHSIDDSNYICLDYYGGMDRCAFTANNFNSDINALWGDQMVSVRYIHDKHRDFSVENNTFFTGYSNKFTLENQDNLMSFPSGIMDFGNKTKIKWKRMTGGLDVTVHDIHPQTLEGDGLYGVITSSKNDAVTVESSLYLDYRLPISDYYFVDAGIRGSVYGSHSTGCFWSVDPSLSIGYDNQQFRVSANYFLRHQFLFQTGFTDAGLPTEFWLSSDNVIKPQYAHSLSLNLSWFLFDYRFRIDGDVFYKRLYNQVDYKGSLYDLIAKPYNQYECIVQGDGENYGCSVSLNKSSGKFTGWLSYSYTRAIRTFTSAILSGTYPASHERPHQMNAVLAYSPSRHWDFGLSFVYASGTPFTAPEYVSLLNGSIIMVYGEHNANRLRPYYRMDISINYSWETRRHNENEFNLSIYNVTCHKNDLFYTVSLEADENDKEYIQYHPVSFFKYLLPAVSYTFKF